MFHFLFFVIAHKTRLKLFYSGNYDNVASGRRYERIRYRYTRSQHSSTVTLFRDYVKGIDEYWHKKL